MLLYTRQSSVFVFMKDQAQIDCTKFSARVKRTNHCLNLSCVFLSNCAKDKTMGPVKVYS